MSNGRVFRLVLAGEMLETTTGLDTDGGIAPEGIEKKTKNTFV